MCVKYCKFLPLANRMCGYHMVDSFLDTSYATEVEKNRSDRKIDNFNEKRIHPQKDITNSGQNCHEVENFQLSRKRKEKKKTRENSDQKAGLFI